MADDLYHNNDNPKITDSVTWTDYDSGSSWTYSGNLGVTSGSRTTGGGTWLTGSGYDISQSFVNQSGDVELDVTNIVDKYIIQIDFVDLRKSKLTKKRY